MRRCTDRRRLSACAVLLFLLAMLAGCGGTSGLVRADQPLRVQRIFELKSPIEWSRFRGFEMETWTVDGFALNRLIFVSNIRDRHHVFGFGRATRRSPDGAFYRRGMNANELEEIVVDGLAGIGAANVSSSNLRPQPMGALTGFRFEFSFQGLDGLIYRGIAVMVERRKFLNLVVYMAPQEYYFPRDQQAVDALLNTITVRP